MCTAVLFREEGTDKGKALKRIGCLVETAIEIYARPSSPSKKKRERLNWGSYMLRDKLVDKRVERDKK